MYNQKLKNQPSNNKSIIVLLIVLCFLVSILVPIFVNPSAERIEENKKRIELEDIKPVHNLVNMTGRVQNGYVYYINNKMVIVIDNGKGVSLSVVDVDTLNVKKK